MTDDFLRIFDNIFLSDQEWSAIFESTLIIGNGIVFNILFDLTAIEDLRKAMEIDENYPGIQEKLKKAQKMLKQSKKRDYYKILNVPR